ncbi:MAG: reductive dehalogenase domain-containing protein [Candidatus Omnitrophica bacterium]|nr:reductive dehalogenase domain-containing protein [Candidatus Omnitrophota bacterium]
MDKNKNYAGLKKFCLAQGIELFGVADIREAKKDFQLSEKLLSKLDRAVCLGLRLSGSVLEEISLAPTRLYFHHYRTVNASLDQIALKVANFIQKKGFQALPVPASIILDWENQKAHLSHKKLGVLAGLGWLGRNNLLVNKELGSQFRLSTILTDMPLKLDKPLKENCGTCRICVKVCPAQAIKDSPQEFEHLRCFEKLKEFQKQKLVDQYVCGVCVNACKGK